MTILQTNNYFGINATGVSAVDMLLSYRSFGFHANWRTVLYGTIVLVLMITYPRKFKKASPENTGSICKPCHRAGVAPLPCSVRGAVTGSGGGSLFPQAVLLRGAAVQWVYSRAGRGRGSFHRCDCAFDSGL